ncbi:hypothetical protein ACN47E_003169 [Coniothyrium glycines]
MSPKYRLYNISRHRAVASHTPSPKHLPERNHRHQHRVTNGPSLTTWCTLQVKIILLLLYKQPTTTLVAPPDPESLYQAAMASALPSATLLPLSEISKFDRVGVVRYYHELAQELLQANRDLKQSNDSYSLREVAHESAISELESREEQHKQRLEQVQNEHRADVRALSACVTPETLASIQLCATLSTSTANDFDPIEYVGSKFIRCTALEGTVETCAAQISELTTTNQKQSQYIVRSKQRLDENGVTIANLSAEVAQLKVKVRELDDQLAKAVPQEMPVLGSKHEVPSAEYHDMDVDSGASLIEDKLSQNVPSALPTRSEGYASTPPKFQHPDFDFVIQVLRTAINELFTAYFVLADIKGKDKHLLHQLHYLFLWYHRLGLIMDEIATRIESQEDQILYPLWLHKDGTFNLEQWKAGASGMALVQQPGTHARESFKIAFDKAVISIAEDRVPNVTHQKTQDGTMNSRKKIVLKGLWP